MRLPLRHPQRPVSNSSCLLRLISTRRPRVRLAAAMIAALILPRAFSSAPRAAIVSPVDAPALVQLKQDAEASARAGDFSAELAAWPSAIALLPIGLRQHAAVAERIDALTRTGGPAVSNPEMPKQGIWKWLGGLTDRLASSSGK